MRTCARAATSTDGTADLVVARLTDTGDAPHRFRFELSEALTKVDHAVAMAVRGDTFLVAAKLAGDATLTYLEVDSRPPD